MRETLMRTSAKRLVLQLPGLLVLWASGCRPASTPVASCETLASDYERLAKATPCVTVADCDAARTGSLLCFYGPVRTSSRSAEDAELARLERAFHQNRCEAKPCTAVAGRPVTACTRGHCATEMVSP